MSLAGVGAILLHPQQLGHYFIGYRNGHARELPLEICREPRMKANSAKQRVACKR